MMRFMVLVLATAIAAPAMAGNGNGLPSSGKVGQFNLIGKPKGGIGGDNSNGRAIMIPLRNVASKGDLYCPADGFELIDDLAPTWSTSVPEATRLYFKLGTTFDIIDRDGTDGSATIQIPYDVFNVTTGGEVISTTEVTLDVYVRVLGKPGGCMDIAAYAYDDTQGLYFWAGSVYLKRNAGKPAAYKINELFDVWWCNVVDILDADGNVIGQECEEGTTQERSVFDDVFQDYFWNIQNYDLKNVQVRLYKHE